jgi:hypothetical protein
VDTWELFIKFYFVQDFMVQLYDWWGDEIVEEGHISCRREIRNAYNVTRMHGKHESK